MKAIIIDDEINNIENLKLLLALHCPFVDIVATCRNVDDAIVQVKIYSPDLLFLDIQMPNKNGFDLLKSLPPSDVEVIFVTAFDKYAIQAIRFSAIDYLLKPIVVEDLKSAVARAYAKFQSKQSNPSLENLMRMLEQGKKNMEDKIALPSAKETRLVRVNMIVYCESENNYTLFYLQNGEKLVVSKPIFEYEELLQDYGFCRCHNSYLVNKLFVKSIRKEDGGYLLLEDDAVVPISRTRKEDVKQWLLK